MIETNEKDTNVRKRKVKVDNIEMEGGSNKKLRHAQLDKYLLENTSDREHNNASCAYSENNRK